MSLERPFRWSMLTLVVTGMLALTLALASWPWLMGCVVAYAAVVALTAARPSWHLRRGVATLATVVTAQAVVIETITTGTILVPAAHFLLVTQLLWLTQERSNRHYGWLCVVSLLQMMLAGVLSVDVTFGLCFLVYLPAGVSALLFYNLRCELERHGALKPSKIPRVGLRFLAGAGLVALGELVLTILVFMYFPRFGIQILQLKPVQRGERLSGFSDSVRFGDLARVLDNPEVAMYVRLRQRGAAIQADRFPLLLRGIALDHYEHATWSAPGYISHSNRQMLPFPKKPPREQATDLVVQDISLQPMDTRVLFYLPHARYLAASTPNLDDILHHRPSDTYSSQRGNSMSLRYLVYSRLPSWTADDLSPPALSPGEPGRDDYRPDKRLVQLPTSITDRTRELARQIVAGVPEANAYQRAVLVEGYLKGQYDYNLNAGVRTWGVDPVEDFLFRTKAGHCEHFAAAMAVLLRCLGIEARVVTGFSGGEWNGYGQFYLIRQRHAHAWVEAKVPSVSDWVTFDPTPPSSASPVMEHGLLGDVSSRMAFVRLWWNNNVVNFSSNDQARLARLATEALSRLPEALPLWGRDELVFGSGHGGVVGFAVVLSVVLFAAFAGYLVVTRALGLRLGWGWWSRRRLPGEPSVGFYRRLAELLRRRGFRRKPSTTPVEFAHAVIAKGGESYRPVEAVTDAFCRVRYGGQSLSADDRAAISRALADLEGRQR